MFSPQKTEDYKKKLLEERVRLLGELEREEGPEDFGSDVDAFDEEADEAEALGNQLAVNRVLREHINDIDAALERMKAGKFGVCEKCGGTISEDVLDALPSSRRCKDCKHKQ